MSAPTTTRSKHNISAEAERQIIELSAAGHPVSRIAKKVGVSDATVRNYRRKYGLTPAPVEHVITQEQLTLARDLLEDGAPHFKVAHTVGIKSTKLSELFPQYESNKKTTSSILAFMREHNYF